MSTVGALSSRQLVVVTGKGGVGKSAVAAAVGLLLAGSGRRTLLLEVDPRESLHAWLEVPPSGGELVAVAPRLFLQHLNPRHEMDDLVGHHLRIGPLVRRVLASPVYGHFADGAPGLKELAVLGHALRLVEGPPIKGAPPLDVVVLDAPASGHGVSLLTAPFLAAEVIRQGPFGRMATRLSGLVADPARCAIVVVTQAEEMPAQEALELQDTLASRLGRGADLLVVNGLFPPLPAARAARADTPELALWRTRRLVNDRELARLRVRWVGETVELPLLPFDRGPDLVAELRTRLEASMGAGDGEVRS
jgi:anion-transporting  ArsA/GET3 family ATPase